MERAEGGRLASLAIVGLAVILPAVGLAQTESQNEILERLERLEKKQTELQQQLESKDARIQELEAQVEQLKASETPKAAAVAAPPVEPPPEAPAPPEAAELALPPPSGPTEDEGPFGTYSLGRGFGLVRNEWGEVNFGIYTYLRYVNQKGLDHHYTNGLGQRTEVDRRDDVELNKAKIEFRGWIVDPAFQYVLYTWTNNAAQGQGAQVVVGGNLKYAYSRALLVGGGILSLPTTRSTAGNFPYWLTVDHRTMADEFFRGSYSTGFFALGQPLPGVEYYTMLANNLSTLGVDAGQTDGDFTTTSTAIWWMPTTGEYGPRSGFGDYEDHQDVATRLGVHFSFSPEDRQSQPGSDDIDNTQIRLSNGTIIFTPDALADGVRVNNVKYYMADVDAGLKYRGFALEGEYYLRWLDDIRADGPIPDDSFFDHGFQVMGSMMVVPQTVQLYTMGSYIFGEFGDPWEVTAGLNWWLFRRREIRLNLEYIYDYESAIGYTAVPQAVGGTGSIFDASLEMSF